MSLFTKYIWLNKPAKMATFSVLIFISVTSCQAATGKADTDVPLPLGVVLDSEGNPISLPPRSQSALDFHSPTITKPRNRADVNPTPQKRTNTKKLTRKQQLASRAHIANDPSCRWLNSRMNKLEQNLTFTGNGSTNSYHRKELVIREKEWKCMKCGAEGPQQKDRDRCQYRR